MKGYLALEILSNEVVDFDNKGVDFIQESINEKEEKLHDFKASSILSMIPSPGWIDQES